MPSLIGTYITNNYLKNARANGTNGRTLVVKVYDSNSNITDDTLNQVIAYLTTSHGTDGSGDDAFTVAGLGKADGSAFVTNTGDTVYLLLQGTGSTTVGTADCGISGVTVSIEAIFQDNYV